MCEDETPLQESTKKKRRWLSEIKKTMPPGTRVRIVDSDLGEYIGATGTVVDYDTGLRGDYPLIGVQFDAPIMADGKVRARDGFYDDELKLLGGSRE